MEPETVINLFDSMWFHLGILETPPETSISPTPRLQTQQNPSNLKVSRQISLLARSKSDELSSFATQDSSPDSVLKPHLQTILSDKEISIPSEIPKSPVMKEAVRRRHDRRKKRLSKSLSELEFEEVKGFIDIGFVFSEEDKEDPALVEMIPGLQKLGQKTESRDRENEEKRRVEEASRMRARPYLSEAWEFYREEEQALMKWRVPAATNEMDIKDSLKSWAHTVASAVR
ncbi:uncharacterized protein LOC131024809 [Salvia miltiorrhiza]|uniref:uncharacterized protein LOC131024809 n=1 Tax=Salvia miltiorrhiza TaxID=226208 RepID=UPI0025ABCF65|nr:uncharacterized protein LOC131024809 [Salvia miltiorrhiza]